MTPKEALSSSNPASPIPLSDSYGRPRNFSSASHGSTQRTVSGSLKSIIRATSTGGAQSRNSPITTVVPDELMPIVTLIHAQQSRCYFEASVRVPADDADSSTAEISVQSTSTIIWRPALIKLIGTDLAIWPHLGAAGSGSPRMTGFTGLGSPRTTGFTGIASPRTTDSTGSTNSAGYAGSTGSTGSTDSTQPIIINISDSELEFFRSKTFFDLKIKITNEKSYFIRTETDEDLDYLFAGLLLSQCEFKQLQESFTGALLSSKAVNFSDIRTLLDPNNQHSHEEWCILRFPFINDKWVRCYVVTIPPSHLSNKIKRGGKKNADGSIRTGKVEIYISSNTSKKNLLASVTNGRSCYSLYPESPEYIDNNALIRIWGDCYINHQLLQKIINENTDNEVVRSTSKSLSKRLSSSSLRHSRNSSWAKPRESSFSLSHRHTDSGVSLASSHSEAGFAKRPQKMKNLNILQTKLCYLIPETHGSVSPCETMIRSLIPIMNAFHLYGRPEKFSASREESNSLLFGFPQLPHTQYLDMQNAYDLVSLNIKNSMEQHWSSYEWVEVFKEMVHVKMSKGWNGTGSIVETFRDGLLYDRNQLMSPDYLEYDPVDDFGDNSNTNSSSIVTESPPMTDSIDVEEGKRGVSETAAALAYKEFVKT
ncbi:hypothetical protein FOA43_002126 [Brettanomyces nanus]|uniref:Skg3/CAF120-like PH-like domain-containing protein n=1 Tax=Eeniella nana TaxID=13502 RepID=A0A875S402_EENNA|nr:uncharacterized protein FOA43_002126 [Brettanomyces nanus]QPG74792.1 hypothetical protein FOA43_002126 [Brettanomyces nanus]